MINISNQQSFLVNIEQLKKDSKKVLGIIGYPNFDLGILLVTPKVIQEYNLLYRQNNQSTDILSFPYHSDLTPNERIIPKSTDDKDLGDIILCPKYIYDDLARWQKTFDERIQILLVHGICHLLGYDHIEEQDYVVMKKLEEEILGQLQATKGE